jgi:hypothetical protein
VDIGTLHCQAATGYVYGDNGGVADPASGTLIGSYPTGAVGGDLYLGVMVPDTTLNITYFLGQTDAQSGSQQYALEAFNLTDFTFLGAVNIPNVVGTPVKLIRWGSNGLTFLTGNGSGGSTQGDGVYLMSGAFVTNPSAETP